MMRRRGYVGLLAAALALLLAGCGKSELTRYKMIVEVETPEGVVSGFAVREIKRTTPPNVPMLGEDRGSVRVRGEAVSVDLPNGKVLFALLHGRAGGHDYAGRDIYRILKQVKRDEIELWPNRPVSKALHVADTSPMLVTFGDISDPTSVERVDPDDLAASFGEGTALKRITVEITDDPVTTGIEERLGWLSEYPEPALNPDHGPKDFSLSATLKHGAFRQGVNK